MRLPGRDWWPDKELRLDVSDIHFGIMLAFAAAITFVAQNFWLRSLQAREGPWRFIFIISVVPGLTGVASWIFLPPQLSTELLIGATDRKSVV